MVAAEFPHWFHSVEKVGDTFWHVLRLRCRGRYVAAEGGMVGWRFEDHRELGRVVNGLFAGMNGCYERLGLSEEMGERISEEVAQLVECGLGGGGLG